MAAQIAPFVTVELIAVFREQTLLVQDDDGRAVGEGNHAEVHVGHLGGVGSKIASRPALRQLREERGGPEVMRLRTWVRFLGSVEWRWC